MELRPRRATSTRTPSSGTSRAIPALTSAACRHAIRKLQGRFYALDYAAALEAAAKAEKYLWTVQSFPDIADYHFFAGLAHAAAYDGAPPSAAPNTCARSPNTIGTCRSGLEAARRTSRTGPRSSPRSWPGWAGDREEATRLYEEAIRLARESGFVHNEALAYETLARFYRERGLPLFRRHLLA